VAKVRGGDKDGCWVCEVWCEDGTECFLSGAVGGADEDGDERWKGCGTCEVSVHVSSASMN
jgi:hypothetical protein